MFSLTYVSSAIKPFSGRELRDLLAHCNVANRRRNVTGMLLYKDGNFMQVLEGEKQTVTETHQIIARDTRHRGLITLLKGDIAEREFAHWSMGFRDLGADLADADGYSEFLTVALTDPAFALHPSRAKKLLLSFKKTMVAG